MEDHIHFERRATQNEKKLRCKRVKKEQKEFLANFMLANVEVAQKKFQQGFTEREYRLKVAELTEKLNELGPTKTPDQWMRVWADQRLMAKRKANVLKRSANKTVGCLSPTSAKIASLLGGTKSYAGAQSNSSTINETVPDEELLISEEIYTVDDDDNHEKLLSKSDISYNYSNLTPIKAAKWTRNKVSKLTANNQQPQASSSKSDSVLKRKAMPQADDSMRKKCNKTTMTSTELSFLNSYQEKMIDNADAQTALLKNCENLLSTFIENYQRIEERKAIALEKAANELRREVITSKKKVISSERKATALEKLVETLVKKS